MIRFNPREHRFVEDPVLTFLREQTGRGQQIVLVNFFRLGPRSVSVCEFDGQFIREIHGFANWPRESHSTLMDVVARLNPVRNYSESRNKQLEEHARKQHEKDRNIGRGARHAMDGVRRRVRGLSKEHPSINWPKVKGEGI